MWGLIQNLGFYASATGSFLKRYWSLIAAVLLIIGIVVFEVVVRGCSEPESLPEATDFSQQLIMEQLEADRVEAQQRIEALEQEIQTIHERLDYVDVEIQNNVTNRKVTHAKLKKAVSISDIDAIMQSEFSKHATKTKSDGHNTGIDNSTEGISANPY